MKNFESGLFLGQLKGAIKVISQILKDKNVVTKRVFFIMDSLGLQHELFRHILIKVQDGKDLAQGILGIWIFEFLKNS